MFNNSHGALAFEKIACITLLTYLFLPWPSFFRGSLYDTLTSFLPLLCGPSISFNFTLICISVTKLVLVHAYFWTFWKEKYPQLLGKTFPYCSACMLSVYSGLFSLIEHNISHFYKIMFSIISWKYYIWASS